MHAERVGRTGGRTCSQPSSVPRELGLTGRLRTAAQAERRLEECAKLGLQAVVAPEGTRVTGRGGPRVVAVETLRQALGAALEPSSRGTEEG